MTRLLEEWVRAVRVFFWTPWNCWPMLVWSDMLPQGGIHLRLWESVEREDFQRTIFEPDRIPSGLWPFAISSSPCGGKRAPLSWGSLIAGFLEVHRLQTTFTLDASHPESTEHVA